MRLGPDHPPLPVARLPEWSAIGPRPDPAVGSARDSELTTREELVRLDRAVSEPQAPLPLAGAEENTETPQKNVCQVCGKPIPFPMRLVGSEFCSAVHKKEAERRQTEQWLERLQSDQANLGDVPRSPDATRVVRIRPPASNEDQPEVPSERPVAASGTVSSAEAWRFVEHPSPVPLPLRATAPAFGNSAEFQTLAPVDQLLREPGISRADNPARLQEDWELPWLPTLPPALASSQSITISGLEPCRLAFLQQAPVRIASWIATTCSVDRRSRSPVDSGGRSVRRFHAPPWTCLELDATLVGGCRRISRRTAFLGFLE